MVRVIMGDGKQDLVLPRMLEELRKKGMILAVVDDSIPNCKCGKQCKAHDKHNHLEKRGMCRCKI